MKRIAAFLLSAVLVLSGCSGTTGQSADIAEPLSYEFPAEYSSPNDSDMVEGLEESVYDGLLETLDAGDFLIDEVEVAYVSQEYLDELKYNSQENVFFGYTLSDVKEYFGDAPYVFTVEDGKTVVKQFENFEDTWEKVAGNVAIGTGVILVCATVTVLSPAVGAPTAITAIFAFATKGAVVGAAIDGMVSGAFSGIATGVKTGSIDEAIKDAALSASEGYKSGAIIGAVTGGGAEGIGLLRASKYAKSAGEAGLTMSEAATVQMESGYSLKTIRSIRNMEEYDVYKSAGLKECVVKTSEGTRRFLARDVDLAIVDENGLTNLERMRKGLNPLDENGIPLEYHHVGQKNDGALALLSRSEHDTPGLHYNQESEIERQLFNSERQHINQAFVLQLYEAA